MTSDSPDPVTVPDSATVWRILDANCNRAAEGLRVVEDFLRFGRDDRHLAGRAKNLRHALRESTAGWDSCRLAFRDTPGDVGTTITNSTEGRRLGAREVAEASQARAEQALRCLEEYSKVVDPATATTLERLRYDTYVLGGAWRRLEASLAGGLATAQLYVLVEGLDNAERLRALAASLVAAGVHVLQLRDKRLESRELLSRARVLREVTRGTGTRLIINDRADIALLSDADGVHVGQDDLSVAEARRVVGAERWVGVSTHSIEQARRAVLDGADYLGCGPTFASRTKDFSEFAGLAFLRAVAQETRLPAFAIGGIDASNLPEVLAAGLGRIAVSSAVCAASAPAEAARQLLAELARRRPS